MIKMPVKLEVGTTLAPSDAGGFEVPEGNGYVFQL
jgi:hypothetical protein